MPRSLGNKRKQIPENGDDKGIGFITRLYGDFEENPFVKILPNAFFGYWRVTVEQPLADEEGNDITNRDGSPKPDPKLRDYENIPFLKKDRNGNLIPQTIEEYIEREVKPHLPKAWVDESKTKTGYEINFYQILLRIQTVAISGRDQGRHPGAGNQFPGTGKNGAGGLIMDEDRQDIIIYNTADGKASVSLYAKDGMVWMNQNQLAKLFDTSKQNIGQHIANILKEKELDENSVVKNFFTTAADGKDYQVTFYSLEMVLAIGFRVRSKRGTQFRIWANHHLKEYMVKGFVMDDERLKNPDGRPDYFDELLERIREIRASEKRFYQKVRDLFALSSDYDKTDKATQMFFAETQNKLLYAVTGKTAAEIILERADADKPNMALTSWKGSVVRKQDIFIAKNYLN